MGIREEFEKSEHLKERLAICWYDEKIGCYLSIQLCDYAAASYLNGAWCEFQEQQKKIDALKSKIQTALNKACMLQNSNGERIYNELKEILK